ncbi:MAG: hypothetical protein H7Y59_11415 [Anaerolineales bacterium]|nr:hypothetical protein [Anaerolineales bacterium]
MIEKPESKLKILKNIQKLTPEVLDVALATLANPVFGLSLVVKKIAEKVASEANIQKEAEAEFQERVKNLKDDFPPLNTSSNISKTVSHLTDEINKLAEGAVKINDHALIEQVFIFYRSAQKKLLASTAKKPLPTEQLAHIKTELGLIRLKVMWADSQKSAALAQKFRNEDFIQEQARQLNIKEKALQIRAYIVFLIFIGGITAAIIMGSQIWSTESVIPWLNVPISIVFWSAIGSAANMLYRYYKKDDAINIDRELRRAWARPLVGIIMGVVTYLVAVSGLILIGAATPQNINIEIKPEILSLFAFVGSFSDKIFEGVVEKVGLIATSERNDEERLKSMIEILSGEKISGTKESIDKK